MRHLGARGQVKVKLLPHMQTQEANVSVDSNVYFFSFSSFLVFV